MDINYSLICAVRNGNLNATRELIDLYGLSYSKAWSEGYVLLIDAIENQYKEITKLLLNKGAKVNKKTRKCTCTPLHYAVRNGDLEIIEMLLDKGAKINATDKLSNTPLCVAIETGNVLTVEHLLKHGAYVTTKGLNGYTPLHLAVENGKEGIVKLLLKRSAFVDAKLINGVTPLHIASEKGLVHITEELLNQGAYVNSATFLLFRGISGYTPLHFASEKGNVEVVKLLLNKGADINVNATDNKSPLYTATKSGNEKVVKLLLDHGANVDDQDSHGKTILHIAVEKGSSSTIRHVLMHCPDVNNKSNKGSLNAAIHGDAEKYATILENLLQYGFTLNDEDINNWPLLIIAIEKGYSKIVKDFLKYDTNVNMLNLMTEKTDPPLHCATKHKHAEIVALLIRCGADVNAKDKNGKSPIFYAIKNSDSKLSKLFLNNGVNIKDDPDLLNTAVDKGCIDIVDNLLQYGVDINASDKYGQTALHFTALNRANGLFGLFFLHKNFNDNTKAAVKADIAKLLLSRGANVNSQTKDGITTLYAATQGGCTKVVEALLEYNANVNSTIRSDVTPLFLSAEKGDEVITKMLLEKGANVHAVRKYGASTALHIATQKNHHGVVELLLKYGAKVNSKAIGDITPLHVAVLQGYIAIVECLLKFDADVDSRNGSGNTALHIASQEGYITIVKALLESGADINIANKNNFTPLDLAMSSIRTEYSKIENYTFMSRKIFDFEAVILFLERHVIKMTAANLYVNERNLLLISNFTLNNFQRECEEEIERIGAQKICDSNISFRDVLTKSMCKLVIYLRNESIVQTLKSNDYTTKFPIYASFIKSYFRHGLARKILLEQAFKYFQTNIFLFPYDCTEKILGHLTNNDLRNLLGDQV